MAAYSAQWFKCKSGLNNKDLGKDLLILFIYYFAAEVGRNEERQTGHFSTSTIVLGPFLKESFPIVTSMCLRPLVSTGRHIPSEKGPAKFTT